jgi:putative membrane protein
MSTLFAFLHHLVAFTLVSAIAVELVLLRQELTPRLARRLGITDAVLGVAAAMLLIVGLHRVFLFEKGAAFYFSDPAFLTKFAVFVAVAVISLVPTVELLRWRKAIKAGRAPQVSAKKLKLMRAVIHGELLGVVVILLCAAIMAKGGWV